MFHFTFSFFFFVFSLSNLFKVQEKLLESLMVSTQVNSLIFYGQQPHLYIKLEKYDKDC